MQPDTLCISQSSPATTTIPCNYTKFYVIFYRVLPMYIPFLSSFEKIRDLNHFYSVCVCVGGVGVRAGGYIDTKFGSLCDNAFIHFNNHKCLNKTSSRNRDALVYYTFCYELWYFQKSVLFSPTNIQRNPVSRPYLSGKISKIHVHASVRLCA